MDKFVVEGGATLQGSVRISGAKNASLALIPATLLTGGVYRLHNTPNLRDVWTMARLLTSMGAFVELNGNEFFVDTSNVESYVAPYEHVKKMRASIYVLGPLLGRFGKAKVSLPGGCAFGPRPVDLHLKAMEKLGAEITLEGGYINAVAPNGRLKGARIHFDISSVGATGNALMAAVLAEGRTILSNAAIEPEITALARFLNKMGAKIEGIGTTLLEIEGVKSLQAVEETTIPDRIEAGTFLVAGAMTGGSLTLHEANPYHLTALIAKLEEAGCEIDVSANTIMLKAPERLQATDITSAVYPGFPTDLQAQWAAGMLTAEGTTRITDTIYPTRFQYAAELSRMNASVEVNEGTAIIKGGLPLSGATVMSTDLRASASLVLAALVAEGRSDILRVYHLDRGYEALEHKLSSLGASIRRERTEDY